MSENNYATPEADLSVDVSDEIVLASRRRRFFSSIIDGLIIAVVTVPVMYFTGGFEGIMEGAKPSLMYTILIAVLGIVIFLVINAGLLIKHGQTVGKNMLGIKIIDSDSDAAVTISQLLKRYSAYLLVGQIPFIGPFLAVVNILFIFGGKKRCVHDIIAATKVIKI